MARQAQQNQFPISQMAVVSYVAKVAFSPSAMACPSIDIRRRPDSMPSNLDVEWTTIIWCEEYSGLWHGPHNVHQQPLHVLQPGSVRA